MIWQIAGPAALPFWLALASLLAFSLKGRARSAALPLLLASNLLFILFAWLPLGHWLGQPLEQRFAGFRHGAGRADHIIVLTGAEDMSASNFAGRPEFNDGSERMIEAVALSRSLPDAHLWIVGGVGGPGGVTDADWTRLAWIRLGVPAERISVIHGTFNTWQNAEGIARRRLEGRLLLVTSAMHMPRAVLAFRSQGVAVTPYPVDFIATPDIRLASMLTPSIGGNLMLTDHALREWVSLALYRVTGRTGEWLPD